MKDNGLLKKFFSGSKVLPQGAIIDIDKREGDSNPIRIKDGSKFGWGRYFFKHCDSKYQMDAEILLSQVYAKAGFDTALYVPATLHAKSGYETFGVISNDISGKRTFSLKPNFCGDNFYERDRMNFHGEKVRQDRKDDIGDNGYFFRDFVLYNKLQSDPDKAPKFFTPKACREMIKMRLFDLATFNGDRHTGNMFCNINIRKHVTGISLYDYGWSGDVYQQYKEDGADIYGWDYKYCNEFPESEEHSSYVFGKTRFSMASEFRSNETLAKYFSNDELVDTLHKIDIKATARDIEDTIGYEVDPGYQDKLCESIEKLAEEIQP